MTGTQPTLHGLLVSSPLYVAELIVNSMFRKTDAWIWYVLNLFIFALYIYMSFKAQNRFLNFHGHKGARLKFEQSVHGQRFKRSAMMSIFSPLFFYAPEAHVDALHKLFVDEIASSFTWKQFRNKLNSELGEQNLLVRIIYDIVWMPHECHVKGNCSTECQCGLSGH